MVSSSPAYLRKINQRRIIESMLRLRRASRAHISRVSGISSPTVSRIVDDLLTSGILMESDAAPAGMVSLSTEFGKVANAPTAAAVGRPSAPLELDSRRPRFLAVQLGVRQTRVTRAPIALPDADRWEASFPTPSTEREWSKQFALHAAQLPIADLQAVIISVPGVVDESTGRALLSPNLKWLESASLKLAIKAANVGETRVLFVQEIRALALGHLAAGPEAADFFLIDVGTGVGGAAIVNGGLLSGSLPLNGELGHTPVLGNTRVCGCGATGCVETLFSRRGLMMSALEHDSIADWPTLVRHVNDDGIPPWMKRSLDTAAVNIAAALNVLGLRKAVLTGCIAEMPASVTQYLSEAVRADAMWARFGSVEVDTAPRRRLAGMIHSAISRTLLAPEPG